ncbi:hypothetical protein SAMN05421853_102403 [Roseivivax halotolerans]|jgi:hypothetical protein|uniref:Excalibur calcium-binding domain-containing protein n=1 Tax=Roseivivax halotolerans TaxID=93684 RepID=A0A1I5WJU1_9RHOB|nr:hypothetical protein FIU91_15255 [Roseivivax sp. THAF30]SFQ20043.1 hypothetical protein SAMN05421853_102403 [Roseivivax halotolerans]
MMRFHILTPVALLALTACAPSVPDSGAGVGFDSYDDNRRAAVDAELQGTGTTAVQPPADVSSQPLDGASGTGGGDDVAEMAARALDGNSGPVDASPSNPPPQSVTNAAGISDEQNFDSVSGERSIEQDAALIQQNRAQYQVIQPGAVPQRTGNEGPNIVAYALQTNNQVGQPLYRRGPFSSKEKEARNCRSYASSDLAQEAFLAAGGPERDREGLDADGDGFACSWDPSVFRSVRGS